MKKSSLGAIAHLSAIVIWMGVIFMLSAQDGTRSEETSGFLMQWLLSILPLDLQTAAGQEQLARLHSAIRTLAHFMEYAVLGLLTVGYLWRFGRIRGLVLSLGVGMLYAATDEWHQFFVPGRACQFSDWVVDSLGCLFGILLFVFFLWMKKKFFAFSQARHEKGSEKP